MPKNATPKQERYFSILKDDATESTAGQSTLLKALKQKAIKTTLFSANHVDGIQQRESSSSLRIHVSVAQYHPVDWEGSVDSRGQSIFSRKAQTLLLHNHLAGTHISVSCEASGTGSTSTDECENAFREECLAIFTRELAYLCENDTLNLNRLSGNTWYQYIQDIPRLDDNSNSQVLSITRTFNPFSPSSSSSSTHTTVTELVDWPLHDVQVGEHLTYFTDTEKITFKYSTKDAESPSLIKVSGEPIPSIHTGAPVEPLRFVLDPSHGFHPTLHATVTTKAPFKCILPLPPSIFADEYQIRDMAFPTGVHVDTFGVMDLETPVDVKASKSGAVVVKYNGFSNEDRADNITISIPLHMRYQSPGDREYVTIRIPSPICFVSAPSSVEQDQYKTSWNDATSLPTALSTLLNISSHQTHQPIPITSSPLTINVPIGQAPLTPLVMRNTLLVTVLGMLYVLYLVLFRSRTKTAVQKESASGMSNKKYSLKGRKSPGKQL